MTPIGDPAGNSRPRFEFATATRIIFGDGTGSELPQIAPAFGQHVLLVLGSQPQRCAHLAAAIGHAVEALTPFPIAGEPTVSDVEQGAALARDEQCQVVIAIGGGSGVDAGKAISGLATNQGSALDHLEVVGRGMPLVVPALPFIAVPTTAGTGAEVTRNAVLGVPEARVKASLRSPHLLPRIALIDPTLTYTLPPAQTAAGGMDALTQLIEPFLSCRANPLVDALCRDGMARAARALPIACREPRNQSARHDMALAALYSGMALANAGLGAVHGFAAPIGGQFPAPHGAVCATLLPHVLRVNLEALRARQPLSPALARMDEVARLLTGRADAHAGDAVVWCRELAHELQIPSLAAWGVRPEHVPELVQKAARASSMKGNPLPLGEDELRDILESALTV